MIDDTLFEAEEKMDKAVTVAKEDFSAIRTGRANPSMFNKITVEYYGTQTPVNQLASFHLPEPRMVVIQPYDKGSLAAIERAIRNSDLSVNPANDGNIIRIVLPDLTEERRREYIKTARTKAEDGRVAIRNIRRLQVGYGDGVRPHRGYRRRPRAVAGSQARSSPHRSVAGSGESRRREFRPSKDAQRSRPG